MKVKENLAGIQSKIEQACARSGRKPEDIHIIAVTKYVSESRTKEALEAGIKHIGENRSEGLLNKRIHIKEDALWHFIGTLQTRKVKEVLGHVDYIHSLDRLSLAKEINKRASSVQDCFVQVNASGEQSKHGVSPDEVIPFMKELKEAGLENIRIVGLMTMAPLTDDQHVIRTCFRKVKALQQEVAGLNLDFAPCRELSMGMSNDYEIAIEEGSTFIRIGTALVGKDD